MSDQKPRSIIYFCASCHKRSRDRIGRTPIDIGYTEDCSCTAVPIYEDSVVLDGNGRIVKAKVVDHDLCNGNG